MKKIINRIKEQTPLSREGISSRSCGTYALKKGDVFIKYGFTLVEMLVVISIIAILSTILAGGYSNSQKNARDATRKINLKSISDALNSYYADYGVYPQTDELIDIDGTFVREGIVYMKKVPIETSGMTPILYERGISEKSFRLYTNLENEEDKDCIDNSRCELISSGNYGSDKGCCYVITSSNIGATSTLP